ncbi:hypothetical protein EYF80_059023 [Liparis tanakae]|uniref:Uncharacterized protein n=1 Tax=Liparis tanakae TaxID=230148 RepID=A0A4Z2EPV6_9TELE|nr:hypothetical protein EYF80_059023 [Liparis tanakae]
MTCPPKSREGFLHNSSALLVGINTRRPALAKWVAVTRLTARLFTPADGALRRGVGREGGCRAKSTGQTADYIKSPAGGGWGRA